MKNQELHKTEVLAQKATKKPYVIPTLKQYGAIHLVTHSSGASLGDGGPNMMTSDRDTKENIVKVGIHPYGIGLYLFDYKSNYRDAYGYGRQFGVMADEVETVMPGAVSVHANGYKQVNYAMLGIKTSIH